MSGLGTTLHAEPFQCSVSVCSMAPFEYQPTAQTSSALRASTAYRRFAPTPTFGLGTTDHPVPSQCTMSVCSPGSVYPTPHTSPAETALTPTSGPGVENGDSFQPPPSECSMRPLLRPPKPTAQASAGDRAATLVSSGP